MLSLGRSSLKVKVFCLNLSIMDFRNKVLALNLDEPICVYVGISFNVIVKSVSTIAYWCIFENISPIDFFFTILTNLLAVYGVYRVDFKCKNCKCKTVELMFCLFKMKRKYIWTYILAVVMNIIYCPAKICASIELMLVYLDFKFPDVLLVSSLAKYVVEVVGAVYILIGTRKIMLLYKSHSIFIRFIE